jgi:hypothetical protein
MTTLKSHNGRVERACFFINIHGYCGFRKLWMVSSIVKIFKTNPNAKMLVIVGNNQIF